MPPTNRKGKCRAFPAPKKLYYVSPPKNSSVDNALCVTTSRNSRLNAETPQKEGSYDIISKSRALQNDGHLRNNIIEQPEPEKIAPPKACLRKADSNEKSVLSTSQSNEIQKQLEDTLFPQNLSNGENNRHSFRIGGEFKF